MIKATLPGAVIAKLEELQEEEEQTVESFRKRKKRFIYAKEVEDYQTCMPNRIKFIDKIQQRNICCMGEDSFSSEKSIIVKNAYFCRKTTER